MVAAINLMRHAIIVASLAAIVKVQAALDVAFGGGHGFGHVQRPADIARDYPVSGHVDSVSVLRARPAVQSDIAGARFAVLECDQVLPDRILDDGIGGTVRQCHGKAGIDCGLDTVNGVGHGFVSLLVVDTVLPARMNRQPAINYAAAGNHWSAIALAMPG